MSEGTDQPTGQTTIERIEASTTKTKTETRAKTETATTDLSTPDLITIEATTAVGTAIKGLLTPVLTIIEATTTTIKMTTQAAISASEMKEATVPAEKTDVTT